MLTLYHLAISHYSEKARWALDFKGLDYRSRLLTPALHVLRTRWAGGRGTVPLLHDSETGATLGDSTDILHYLERMCPEPALFPDNADEAARASELETFFDEHCARHVSAVLHHHVLDHPRVLAAAWGYGLPVHRRILVRAMLPALRPVIRRARGIDAGSVRQHRRLVFEALDRVDTLLRAVGTDYLSGDRFTVADLTAAAVLAPAVRPPGSPWDPQERPSPSSRGFPPAELVSFLEEVAAHPAASWVRKLWQRHRRPACLTSYPAPGAAC